MSVRPQLESAVRSTSNFLPGHTATRSPAQTKYAVLDFIKSYCQAALNFSDLNVRTVAAKVSLVAIAYFAYKYFCPSTTNNKKPKPASDSSTTGSDDRMRRARHHNSLLAGPAFLDALSSAQSSSQPGSHTTTTRTDSAFFSTSAHLSGRGPTAASGGSRSFAVRTPDAAAAASSAGIAMSSMGGEYDSEGEQSPTLYQRRSPMLYQHQHHLLHQHDTHLRRDSSHSPTSPNGNDAPDADHLLHSSGEPDEFSEHESNLEGQHAAAAAASGLYIPNEESGDEAADSLSALPTQAGNAARPTLDLNAVLKAGQESGTGSPLPNSPPAIDINELIAEGQKPPQQLPKWKPPVTPGLSGYPPLHTESLVLAPPASSPVTPGSTYVAHARSRAALKLARRGSASAAASSSSSSRTVSGGSASAEQQPGASKTAFGRATNALSKWWNGE